MFDISKEVTSLELSKQLWVIGMPLSTGYYWAIHTDENNEKVTLTYMPISIPRFDKEVMYYKAFTAGELLAYLPSTVACNTLHAYLTIHKEEDQFLVCYEYFKQSDFLGRIRVGVLYTVRDKHFPDALAKMCIKLKKGEVRYV